MRRFMDSEEGTEDDGGDEGKHTVKGRHMDGLTMFMDCGSGLMVLFLRCAAEGLLFLFVPGRSEFLGGEDYQDNLTRRRCAGQWWRTDRGDHHTASSATGLQPIRQALKKTTAG